MELHPEIANYIELMKAAGFPAMNSLTPSTLRELVASSPRVPGPEMARVTDFEIDVADGAIPLRLYVPEGEPVAIIDFMHGGGWTMGSIAQSDAACRHLAKATQCLVISVDYRLAPEHPFPTAVEDAYTALEWISGNRSQLWEGGDLPVIVAGDSAGANLAAVLCILARDCGGPRLVAQILLVPSTDGDIEAPELAAFDSPFLNLPEISWFFDQYVPDRETRKDVRFAPIRASSHADLPPCYIVTAEHDLLRSHGEAYGRKLAEAGVPTMMCRYPGTVHSFVTVNAAFERSQQALADIAAFIAGFARR